MAESAVEHADGILHKSQSGGTTSQHLLVEKNKLQMITYSIIPFL